MERFISQQNIKHFRDELERGVDAGRRPMLLKLLTEEYERLGLTNSLKDRIDQHIAKLHTLIALQAKLVDDLKALREPLDRAELVLASLRDLQACYMGIRERIG